MYTSMCTYARLRFVEIPVFLFDRIHQVWKILGHYLLKYSLCISLTPPGIQCVCHLIPFISDILEGLFTSLDLLYLYLAWFSFLLRSARYHFISSLLLSKCHPSYLGVPCPNDAFIFWGFLMKNISSSLLLHLGSKLKFHTGYFKNPNLSSKCKLFDKGWLTNFLNLTTDIYDCPR